MAARADANLREYRVAVPLIVVIGDIEPFPRSPISRTGRMTMKGVIQAVQHAVGKPVSYLFVDINWGRQVKRQQSLPAVAAGARQQLAARHDLQRGAAARQHDQLRPGSPMCARTSSISKKDMHVGSGLGDVHLMGEIPSAATPSPTDAIRIGRGF